MKRRVLRVRPYYAVALASGSAIPCGPKWKSAAEEVLKLRARGHNGEIVLVTETWTRTKQVRP